MSGRPHPTCLFLLVLAAPQLSSARGQALPARPVYQGFQLPNVEGSLHYAISASELATFGYNGTGDTVSATSLSGNLAYLSKSDAQPFSMVYSGGYLWNTGGQPSSPYQNLALSQALATRLWRFSLSDSVNYLPYSPVTGLSGIPGQGDLSVLPVAGSSNADQGVLASYAPRISNAGSGSVQRQVTGSTSVSGTGSYTILRFVGDAGSGGIESNQATGVGGLSHRIDARSSVSANYVYSNFSYLATGTSFVSQGVNLEYLDQLSRKLAVDLSVGPQRSSGSALGKASLNVAASLHLTYTGHLATTSFGYTRSTNAGSGVTPGGRADNVEASASRRSNRLWNKSVSARYTHSTSLADIAANAFSSDVVVGSVQVNRQVGRSLSAFASYTVDRQGIQGTTTGLTPFNGTSQVLAVGLTYSPRMIHLNH